MTGLEMTSNAVAPSIGIAPPADDRPARSQPPACVAERHIEYRRVAVPVRPRGDDSHRFHASLLRALGDAVIATDLEGRITYWNAHAERLYGWSAAEAIGASILEVTSLEAHRIEDDAALPRSDPDRVWRGEMLARRRGGEAFRAHVTLAPIPDARGAPIGLVSVSRDIGAMSATEHAIRDEARQQRVIAALRQHAAASIELAQLLEHAAHTIGEGLGVRYCEILQLGAHGHSLVARAGSGWKEGWREERAAEAGSFTQNRYVLDAGVPVVINDFQAESRFVADEVVAPHGLRSGVSVTIGCAGGPFGVLSAYSRDVGEFLPASAEFLQCIADTLAAAIDRRAAEERVAYMANFDPLTGLPGRTLLRDLLAQAIAHPPRRDACVGVIFIDLDGFKRINESFGHACGDALLVRVARRLEDCIRQGDAVGRQGSDEFAIVLANMARADDAHIVVQRLLESQAAAFDLGDHQVRVTASLGIAICPVDGGTPEMLLKNASTAMNRAREQGRNGFEFFTEELNVRATGRLALEQELRLAIERQEFTLLYQPELSLETGRIVGVEALVRWRHPVRGLLAPAEFIAVAEETGLILPIGRWVVETACAQAAAWHHRGHHDLFVAVNVSPLEIRRGGVAAQIRGARERSGLNPRCLEVEVTESAEMDAGESFLRTLDELKAIGVTVAIDDFGTGYSTLGYLKRFPIDKVKIDRMFIRDIVTEVADAAIVQAIITMTHHLKLKVTAEGVETEAQAGFLRRCRCDSAQGYLLGMPMGAGDLGALLADRGAPRWSGPRETRRSLLLVDDDPDVLETLQAVFQVDGYDVSTATTAQQALALLANSRIAVILSDQRMPGMTGIELLRRAKVMCPDTVRIVLSGYADPAMAKAAIDEGTICRLLTKPCSNATLREAVREAFDRHERDVLRSDPGWVA